MLKKLRRILSLGLLLFSGCLLIWTSIPSKRQVVMLAISPSEMQLPSSGEAAGPSILETRQVVLAWPSSMRIGDMDEITLVLEPLEKDTPSPNMQADFSDVYDRYNIMLEARFEVAGIRATPANPVRESMLSGQTVKFNWQISAEQAGSYQSNVWLSMRFLPLDGSLASQVPIFVHEEDIRAASLLGMSGPGARLLGIVGIVLSVLIVIDDMIGLFSRWINKKTISAIKEKENHNGY